MADQVRMTSRTVFTNERITVFADGGPTAGVKGGMATVGDAFETDLAHAKDLNRLGLAVPVNRDDLDGPLPALEPHFQVSVPQLAADQAWRAAEIPVDTAVIATPAVDTAVQADPTGRIVPAKRKPADVV